MTLTKSPEHGGWTGHTIFRGRRVEVEVDADMWEVGPEKATESALQVVEQRWSEIERALLGHPLKLYNGGWADGSQTETFDRMNRMYRIGRVESRRTKDATARLSIIPAPQGRHETKARGRAVPAPMEVRVWSLGS